MAMHGKKYIAAKAKVGTQKYSLEQTVKLLPEVSDPTVRELLRRHRTHLARHLAEARRLH